MASLLPLMSEYFDRMTNPAYGSITNDEYAFRLAELTEGPVGERLAVEVKEVDSSTALTQYGWSWLLSWARQREVRPRDDVLFELVESATSIALKAQVIDLATFQSNTEEFRDVPDIGQFPDPWLQRVLSGAVGGEGFSAPAVHQVYRLLMALILVDTELSIAAASALINHRWAGEAELVNAFWRRTDLLDDDTRSQWISALRPPPVPGRENEETIG